MALSGQRHLGLFVIGQLAARHGIAVSLLESAYGGTKAIVLVPSDVVEGDGIADAGPSALGGQTRDGQPREIPAAEVAPGQLPQPRSAEGPGQRGARAAGDPTAKTIAPPTAWMGTQATAAASAQPPEMPTGSRERLYPGSGSARHSRAALPRRERMASLAPELRPDAETADSAKPWRPRSPDEARGSMTAFQQGTRLVRNIPDKGNQ
jgi:hypothetical protein